MAQPHDPAALERISADLDRLIRDVRLGHPSHRATERNIAEGERLAEALRAVFRSPTKPSAAPLYVSADGLRAGW